jgi:hypothetical protein
VSSAALAHGQLRIVQYNLGDVKPGLSTVLEQIGKEKVNGVAKPLDIIIAEEQDNAASVANLAATLNTIYGAGTYVAAPYVGISSGGGLPSIVYRASSVSLVGSPVGIGNVGTTSNARQTIKYQIRPAGYDSSADFYLYASHLKASDTGADAARRNAEVITNRADADAMGPGRSIIYAGDFNLYSGNEAGFTTYTSAGNGQAIDPVHAPLNWSGTSNRIYFTQSPATTAAYGGQVTGGMNDRFDFQLSTAALNDGEGMSIIPGSYRPFGNNGTQPLNGAINSGSNTWDNSGLSVPRTTVLNALAQASDHIPVVADYQLPAKMGVNVASVPAGVIVGANVPVNVTVTNVAPVTVAIGADELDYSVSGTGAISGAAAGIATATLTGNTHALSFNTSTPGVKSGTVNVSSSSQSAANASFSQAASTTVLAHATPSLNGASAVTNLSLDFGIRAKGLAAPALPFSINNLADVSGFTAGLDGDSIVGNGDTARLATTLTTFTNQSAGTSRNASATADTSTLGDFNASYILATSDQDLPGAAARQSLTLQLHATIALGGDANLDGLVDVADLGILAMNWDTSGGWLQGDFNRDGVINVDDLNLLALDWQGGGNLAASLSGLGLPTTSIPEPTFAAILLLGLPAVMSRRRK